MTSLVPLNFFIWPVVSVSAQFVIKTGLRTLQLFIFCISWHTNLQACQMKMNLGVCFLFNKGVLYSPSPQDGATQSSLCDVAENITAEDWKKEKKRVSFKILFRTFLFIWDGGILEINGCLESLSCARTNNKS